MSRLSEIEKRTQSMSTLVELTSVFEGIASMRIARVKNQVLQSTQFFKELWDIYTQLRVDSLFRYGRENSDSKVIDKELLIIITAEGGFSGDIDQRIVVAMLEEYDPKKHDVIVIGRHGANQLTQRNIAYRKYFALPSKDQNIDPTPITNYIQQYSNTLVFYPEYVSLMNQQVRSIAVNAVVADIGSKTEKPEDVISEDTYIFEPSTYAVIGHIESSMLKIAMSQLILQSKLAQYASRFRAMSASHQAADDSLRKARLKYNRTKRAIKDDRLKETINGMKKISTSGGSF